MSLHRWKDEQTRHCFDGVCVWDDAVFGVEWHRWWNEVGSEEERGEKKGAAMI